MKGAIFDDTASAIAVYDTLSKPPASALKKITGGRINGKTDIKPQWRYKAMTEAFGLCGIGWKYTIDRQWIESGDAGEIMAFVNVSVYVKNGDAWSDAIPGTGGSMLTTKEKAGLYNSDEAYKMATTDALSVALKFLGVASAIYAGQWDGTKYIGASSSSGQSAEDIIDTQDWEYSLADSDTMKTLQAQFKEAWIFCKGNAAAQHRITAVKDKRKRELA